MIKTVFREEKTRFKRFYSSYSDDEKILLGFFISLLLLWFIFEPVKNMWNDDPFQKVILAPLSEEPFKLLLAFTLCIAYYLLGFISHLTQPVIHDKKHEMQNSLSLNKAFLKAFVPLSITCGVIFGVTEGSIRNIILHASISSIAAVLILYTYKWLKDKKLMIGYKLLIILSTLSVPMMLHSIANQYANIMYVNGHREYEYLIIIGRFLSENTPMNNQTVFTIFLLTINLTILVAWFYNNVKHQINKKKRYDA